MKPLRMTPQMIDQRLTPRPATRSGARFSTLAAASALALAGFCAGCDRGDPTQKALEEASKTLTAVSTGGSTALATERRKSDYQQIVSKLKAVGEPTDAGQATALHLLLSRGNAGMGEIAAQAVARSEAKFLGEVGTARAMLDKWVSQNAIADALKEYDPAPDLAQLDKQIAEKDVEVKQLQQQEQALAAQVAGLKRKADDAQTQAKALRDDDAATRATFASLSQTARASALEQAVSKRRDADGLEKQSSLVMAEVGNIKPQLDEFAKQIQRIKAQQDLFRESKVNVQTRARQGQEQSAVARAEAVESGEQLDQQLELLAKERQTLTTMNQEAIKAYSSAVASAKKSGTNASRESKTAGNIVGGNSQQALADVLATRARSLMSYAELLELASSIEPKLAKNAEYAKAGESVRAETVASAKEAIDAYKSALALYSGSGASGDIKAKMESLKAALGKLHGVIDAPAPDAAPQATPEGDKPAPMQDAGEPAASSPKPSKSKDGPGAPKQDAPKQDAPKQGGAKPADPPAEPTPTEPPAADPTEVDPK